MAGLKVAVSGGFDPIHIGHVRMFREAQQHGALEIYLNSDRFLREKKGRVFMSFLERAEILKEWGVVRPVIDEDQTVCNTMRFYNPDIFMNGGDRDKYNTPEKDVCNELGIRMLYSVGGSKIQSSSELLDNYNKDASISKRRKERNKEMG